MHLDQWCQQIAVVCAAVLYVSLQDISYSQLLVPSRAYSSKCSAVPGSVKDKLLPVPETAPPAGTGRSGDDPQCVSSTPQSDSHPLPQELTRTNKGDPDTCWKRAFNGLEMGRILVNR